MIFLFFAYGKFFILSIPFITPSLPQGNKAVNTDLKQNQTFAEGALKKQNFLDELLEAKH
jgi:hypothetical protein